ncbi:MAG: hypothetical protein LQ338_003644 [Usnochroma carphineum]|nr:MAG: hypothetical protein LQ338_003644 [Usnochroma carphineum]
MLFSNRLTVLSYLLFLASHLLAVPLSISSHPAVPQSLEAQQQHHRLRPRVNPAYQLTWTSNTHRAIFSMLMEFYPLNTLIVRAINNIYFEIIFNLSNHGPWYNIPPMSRVLVKSASIYLLFMSTDPNSAVPWSVVRDWAESMDYMTLRGGFLGTYVASFSRLVDDEVVEWWVHMGIGSPPELAAAAAKRRVKGK